jgi:hypothetical protein
MKIPRGLLVVPVAVLLAACGGDAEETDTALIETETPAAETAPPPGATTTPQMPAMPMTAQLQSLQDSGVTGEATITGRGNQTEVMVRLMGAPPGGSHPGHIHSGTCQAIGGVVQALQPVAVDSAGTGTMTTTVDVPANTAMNGQHIVVYHGAGGTPVTCAAIPAHMM